MHFGCFCFLFVQIRFSIKVTSTSHFRYVCCEYCNVVGNLIFYLQPGDFSVSMKAPDRIKHFNVKNLPDSRLGIGQRKFDSMDELIQHYRRAPIYTTTNEGKMYLGQGLPKR